MRLNHIDVGKDSKGLTQIDGVMNDCSSVLLCTVPNYDICDYLYFSKRKNTLDAFMIEKSKYSALCS